MSFTLKIFRTLDDGAETLRITYDCDARWLPMEPAVARIIDKWKELNTQFDIVHLKENIYTAEILLDIAISQHIIIFINKKAAYFG
jgi:hypothetical protein